MVKRSPPPSSSSCSSNSSTNSSSYSNEPEIVQLKPKPRKRAKRLNNNNHIIDHCDHDDNNSNVNAKKKQSSGKRSSIYRGVTRHRWTGRFEAHLWDKSCWNNVQNKKGRQVYLGAYDSEEAAARTYDLAALKYWGPTTILNFTIDSYTKDVEEMEKVSREEYLASLRRRSSGFSRGVSKYRGVARHHHNGRWEARIGRVFGNKYLYLGTYKTQEEAAAAYDMAAIEYRGVNAVTNFDISNYLDRLKVETTSPNPDDTASAPSPSPPPLHTPPQAIADPHLHAPLPCLDVDHPDLAWGYLDAGFVSLPIDNPEELLDLFDNVTGFEENIDQIFGPASGFDDQVDSGSGGGGGSRSTLSSSDSQSSTITSVSCM